MSKPEKRNDFTPKHYPPYAGPEGLKRLFARVRVCLLFRTQLDRSTNPRVKQAIEGVRGQYVKTCNRLDQEAAKRVK